MDIISLYYKLYPHIHGKRTEEFRCEAPAELQYIFAADEPAKLKIEASIQVFPGVVRDDAAPLVEDDLTHAGGDIREPRLPAAV